VVALGQQVSLLTQAAPLLQWQELPLHVSPVLQLWPQAPQLEKSPAVLMQVVPQQVWPAAHCVLPQRHLPPEQVSFGLQVVVQLPQWLGSFCRLAQPLLQQVSPVEQIWPLQAQAPLEQLSGVAQAWPQLPQLALSLARSLQALPPQQIAGVVQVVAPQAQVPLAEHIALAPLTQHTGEAPVQAAPLPQVQAPLTHDSPGLQAWPQVPQWKASVLRSMQPRPAQQVCPLVQAEPPPQRHLPPEQPSPLAPHFMPQPPQLLTSASVERQPLLQQTSLAGQLILPAQRVSISVTSTGPLPNAA
jgi:hypothetical protein